MINNKIFFKHFFSFFLLTFLLIFKLQAQIFDNQLVKLQQYFIALDAANNKDAKTDSISFKLDSVFTNVLTDSESFTLNFASLSNYCKKVSSDDGQINILTWFVFYPHEFKYKYYGYIQYNNGHNFKFYKLFDNKQYIKDINNSVLGIDNWYGCVYYEIITKKVGKTTLYSLLGWDGNDILTNRKLIEVLTINNNIPTFGYDFTIDNVKSKRVIFNYSKQASMSLKWNADLKMIIWDHLSPSEAKFTGIYQYYGPDFSYDGLVFKQKQWLYVPDVDVKNEKKK